jgi:hypothetical protein
VPTAPKPLWEILRQAATPGVRGNVVSGLGWMSVVLVAAVSASSKWSQWDWVTLVVVWFCGAYLIAYLFLYIFLLVRDPESLRTERFVLEMKKIDKGELGDSEAGIVPEETKSLPQAAQDAQGDDKDDSPNEVKK